MKKFNSTQDTNFIKFLVVLLPVIYILVNCYFLKECRFVDFYLGFFISWIFGSILIITAKKNTIVDSIFIVILAFGASFILYSILAGWPIFNGLMK
jgi:hypothetical protein